MNVAIVVPRIAQVGPVKVMQALVNSLTDVSAIKINVFYFDRNVDERVKFNVPVTRLKVWSFPFSDFDVVHTNGFRPDLFAFFFRNKIKCHISTIHNFVFKDLFYTYNSLISLILGNIWLILLRRADRLVCVSESMKIYYRNRLPFSKLDVILNGIAEVNESKPYDSLIVKAINSLKVRGLFVIGSSGILNKRKGFEQILLLLSRNMELAFVVFGEGIELSKLKKLAIQLNVSDRVLFFGFRSYPVNYYKHLDLYVMPSRSEGFCLSLVEAVKQKLPVLCSDLDVFQELFNEDEVTFFRLDDLSSLSNAFNEAKETSNKKVDLAFLRYLHNYTDKLMALKYLDLYKSAS